MDLARLIKLFLQFRVGDKGAFEPFLFRGRKLAFKVVEKFFRRHFVLGASGEQLKPEEGIVQPRRRLRILPSLLE